jgi:hypothetical protein
LLMRRGGFRSRGLADGCRARSGGRLLRHTSLCSLGDLPGPRLVCRVAAVRALAAH